MSYTKSMLGSLATACFLAFASSVGVAADSTKVKGPQPPASPGWIVIEEEFYTPWFYAPLDSYHEARVHFRAREEKAAASELRKAETWLRYASTNALPNTKLALEEAGANLHNLAFDLESGNTVYARQLDAAMARASQSLAQWHYYKANENIGRADDADSKMAAKHLSAAARHLNSVANSIHYDNRAESAEYYDQIDDIETVIYANGSFNKQLIEDNVRSLDKEIQKMAAALKNTE